MLGGITLLLWRNSQKSLERVNCLNHRSNFQGNTIQIATASKEEPMILLSNLAD